MIKDEGKLSYKVHYPNNYLELLVFFKPLTMNIILHNLLDGGIMSKNIRHVVPDPKGGWNVKNEGSSRASKRFDTQQDAIKYARNKSKAQRSEVVIHKPDGTIRDKRSYEHDPFPPRNTHK